ncbi:Uncharacterised protein [Mycolicibacterium aurum]|uniref:Uncharacterized protein n=1 Tax=Mycolicibacterium aurum TaxID=1791 RepID=A0A448ITD6_MYCAU|nr:hypothetical protein [Mycolicibacterium aurum]VEG55654.1 Uncharacterised protein [Mycolicibacterium aurum]
MNHQPAQLPLIEPCPICGRLAPSQIARQQQPNGWRWWPPHSACFWTAVRWYPESAAVRYRPSIVDDAEWWFQVQARARRARRDRPPRRRRRIDDERPDLRVVS